MMTPDVISKYNFYLLLLNNKGLVCFSLLFSVYLKICYCFLKYRLMAICVLYCYIFCDCDSVCWFVYCSIRRMRLRRFCATSSCGS